MAIGMLVLSDGRKLGYSEWGRENAPPIIYCHGFPGSHLETELTRSILERHALDARIVALDRPGFGSSTFQTHRSLLDWPKDVAEAADLLGIDRFAVLGVSGGGPYALACGYALGERVTQVGVVVGIAPMDAPGMDHAAISRIPSNTLVRRFQFAMAAMAFRRDQEDRFVEQAVATMGEADRNALKEPKTREQFAEIMRAAFAQGGRAAAHEAGLYLKPWGFDPRRVTVETHLWYGCYDETVPASAGRWLADHISSSELVVWPRHGHFTWSDGSEAIDIFTAILGNEKTHTSSV